MQLDTEGSSNASADTPDCPKSVERALSEHTPVSSPSLHSLPDAGYHQPSTPNVDQDINTFLDTAGPIDVDKEPETPMVPPQARTSIEGMQYYFPSFQCVDAYVDSDEDDERNLRSSAESALPEFLGEDDDNVDYLLGDESGIEGEEDVEFQAVPDDDENEVEGVSNLKQKRASLPTWLRQTWADYREQLGSEMAKNASRRPTCYDRGTFIDGPVSSCFTIAKKFQPSPSDFYSPKFFVWLPHLLSTKIPCPACLKVLRKSDKGGTQFLNAKGWAKSPRRVVDLEECIYIVGYRYACPNSQCRKSFQSWSPELLTALPRSLSIHFTHHLTYRSGLTDRVVALMRSCFQHGIGPSPFAEMIRTQHLRRYEHLHIEYLEAILIRTQSAAGHFLKKFEPFGLFNNRDGYAGFTPSAAYFRNFYVRFIAAHAKEMDQHMAMLSADILQIDHSFKVINHLGKVSGETVFAGGLPLRE
ncbi:hypothetical protein H0H93_003132 [Arthromyces matolae]|nr:hypothetical protein H0H93_003132 [Arthromyces matolae]